MRRRARVLSPSTAAASAPWRMLALTGLLTFAVLLLSSAARAEAPEVDASQDSQADVAETAEPAGPHHGLRLEDGRIRVFRHDGVLEQRPRHHLPNSYRFHGRGFRDRGFLQKRLEHQRRQELQERRPEPGEPADPASEQPA